MLAESANRTVCFHIIYQETQFCGRSPRERVNHVNIVVFVVDVVIICYLLYYYCIVVLPTKDKRYK